MNAIKALAFLFGSLWLGWVAYMGFVVPANVDAAMEQPMKALEGSSIGQEIKQTQAVARQQHCDAYQDLLANAWDRGVENGTLDRDTAKIEELEQQVERHCA